MSSCCLVVREAALQSCLVIVYIETWQTRHSTLPYIRIRYNCRVGMRSWKQYDVFLLCLIYICKDETPVKLNYSTAPSSYSRLICFQELIAAVHHHHHQYYLQPLLIHCRTTDFRNIPQLSPWYICPSSCSNRCSNFISPPGSVGQDFHTITPGSPLWYLGCFATLLVVDVKRVWPASEAPSQRHVYTTLQSDASI